MVSRLTQQKLAQLRMSSRLIQQGQPSKYRNRKTILDGEKFDSMAEAKRYHQLQMLQRMGEISNLTRQVSFELAPACMVQGARKRALVYRADFTYNENGKQIVEDVKGKLTEGYIIKRHLMKSVFDIEIRETK